MGPASGVSSQAHAAQSAYLMVADEQLLCDPRGLLMPLDETLARPWLAENHPEWLGQWGKGNLYAVPLEAAFDYPGGQWLSLRTQLGEVDEVLFTLAGRALQLGRWRREHRFCGRCGGATEPMGTESARLCPTCELRFYPRLSPCMITLITREDHCLLARHARSRQGFHTALAGFVEVGERVEDTVHREIHEEVGLAVAPPQYFGSQPWPFPGQLMLGFHAEYRAGEICVDGDEILTADWWRFDELPQVPPPQTLAGQLIAHFVATQHNKRG